ncbi:HAMP domain-containing protein [Janibacter melonis]|uniref:HAMP domain-containing protein n=1 Tax=Janibacter melonis TaxID=262209 RepID=UPI0020964DAF|nr:HAMP domain-containing protein [Janibacter melonis]
MSIISGVLGWFATQRALRPLRKIEDVAAAIAAGDLSRRVPVRTSHDEVASLSDSLNVMLGRIEGSFSAQEASETRMRQFVADASHELRTPWPRSAGTPSSTARAPSPTRSRSTRRCSGSRARPRG